MTKFFIIFIALCVLLVNAKENSSEKKNKKECPCVNTREYNPVCASDNKTYNNPGEVRCANKCQGKKLKIKSSGACPCLCINTKEFRPVCASDGKTYVNLGAIRCHNQCSSQNIKFAFLGPCHKDDVILPY